MPERPTFYTRSECGACGHRRAWTHALHLSAEGVEIGTVSPNSPGGPLDDPCPACGCEDRTAVARCWRGPHSRRVDGSAWRYNGPGQPGQGWKVPMPDEDGAGWPAAVPLADVTAPPIVGTALRIGQEPEEPKPAPAPELPADHPCRYCPPGSVPRGGLHMCACGHSHGTHAEGGPCLAFPGPTARDTCPCQGFHEPGTPALPKTPDAPRTAHTPPVGAPLTLF